MEARGKHLTDQCGSQTAELFEFEWDCMKTLAESRGIAAEDNPFHPYVGIHMPPQDAQRLAQARSRRIFTSHNELRAILERHEGTIQKRWIKKTNKQRLAVLLKVWPNSKFLLLPYSITFECPSPPLLGYLAAIPKAAS